MSAAARSILVYAIYLVGQGAALLLVPSFAASVFGLPEPVGIWVRIVGMTVLFFAVYYVVAALNEMRPFFVATVFTRFSVPVIFTVFIVAGLAPWNLILLTPFDIVLTAWTVVALLRTPATARVSAG